jgi:hypothetical protein
MARKKTSRKPGEALFPRAGMHSEIDEPTLLDIVDNVLNRGVVLNGDLMLGVANVDLIYAKLSVLLAAIDKLEGPEPVFRPVAAGRGRTGKKKVKSKK